MLMRRRCRRHIADGPGVTVVPLLVLLSLSRCCRCRRHIGAAAALTRSPIAFACAGAGAAAAVFVELRSSLVCLS
ncbi:hypothetical protein BC827DRAFT_1175127 [Russula dissimulans]|nr:hypothetical protein BC827DRAFT_1175127 [Russula dissimulans]